MGNVIQLKPSVDTPNALRSIADQIESGEIQESECTLIIGRDVYHLGVKEDYIAFDNSVINMTYGIHKLMNSLSEAYDE